MFLDWIAQLRLLQHDSQTNILGSLPLSIRRVLISEITGYLSPISGNKHPPDASIFASPAHVKWYMEVIGQGFNLPLEDMAITNHDVDIYARWLFEQDTRPLAVVQEGLEQEFFQMIFHQFSLLFQPRIAKSTNASFHTSNTNTVQNQYQKSFHINMLPVHTHAVPLSFTAPPSTTSSSSSSSNQQQPPPPPPPQQPQQQSTLNTATNNNNNAQATVLKETLSQLVQRHIELCKKTLKVFAMAGRTLKLSADTWAVLLKVMLGITDYLLKEPIGESSSLGVMNMADELCDSLLQVLFELWLRSNTMDVEMWDILKSCFSRWTHRPQAIQQWSSTSLALTKRIQHQVYNDTNKGTDGVYVNNNGLTIKLDLPADFVSYAWHRIMYLIPHPLQLPANNFTLTMLGIGHLVDTLNHTENADHPDGNILLHMFGTFLFDATTTCQKITNNVDAQRGCAESFATLCRIFTTPQFRQPFLRTYVERFYAALGIGLTSDACLPTILLSCTQLFASDLEGVRMLVPKFISAIKRVLPKLRFECKTNVSLDNLRLAAIKVLSTIMCLPNHHFEAYDDTAVSDPASVEQEQLVTQLIRVLYQQHNNNSTADKPSLKFYILEVLLMSLRTETSSYNMRYLLHLINVYVIEDVPFCPGLVGTVVKLIQDKILTMQLPADVTLVAFDVLMDFVDLYEFVKRDSKNVARELVLALSRYVDTLISQGKLAQTYPLIVQAYDCMIKWILVGQWIIDDRDCYKAVIATLSKGITLFDVPQKDQILREQQQQPSVEKKKRRDTAFPPTKQLFQLPPRVNKQQQQQQQQQQHEAIASNDRAVSNTRNRKKEEVAVRMAAEYCMSLFVNQLGRFAALGGSRSATFDDILQVKQHQKSSHIRYFLIDKRTLLTLIGVTDDQQVPRMIAVIRDTTGKYVWSMQTRYKEQNGVEKSPLPSPTIVVERSKPLEQSHQGQAVTVPSAIAVNEREIPTLQTLFIPGSEAWEQWETVKMLMERQQASEEESNIEYQQPCPVDPMATSHRDPSSVRGYRLLLSQMGLLLPKNRGRITPLHITDTFISEMETLDMLNERDCISISAYYAKSGRVNWTELVESPPALNPQFMQFVHCLGWPVKTEQHKGFKGKLDASICHTMPYYSDRTVEFVVNVPYFLQLPTDNMQWGSNHNTIAKIHQQVASDDHVCVIWIEDLAHYKELAHCIKNSSSPHAKAMVYLFVNPLKESGLYWVRILVPSFGSSSTSLLASQRLNENALIFGPLVDGIVVSCHALGSMVRSTAISAHQACRVVTDTYTRPYVIRKEYLEEMAHRHRVKTLLSEFYSDLFAEKDH